MHHFPFSPSHTHSLTALQSVRSLEFSFLYFLRAFATRRTRRLFPDVWKWKEFTCCTSLLHRMQKNNNNSSVSFNRSTTITSAAATTTTSTTTNRKLIGALLLLLFFPRCWTFSHFFFFFLCRSGCSVISSFVKLNVCLLPDWMSIYLARVTNKASDTHVCLFAWLVGWMCAHTYPNTSPYHDNRSS